MWWRIVQYCNENGIAVKWGADQRLPFPAPRYEQMRGFRFSQEALLKQALQYNVSCCIKAVTRFGKTTLLINTLRAFNGLTTVVTAPGIDLLKQLKDEIAAALPDRQVVMIGGSSKTKFASEDITVCSMDSLDKCDHGRTRLLLIDEPHAAVTRGRIPDLLKFSKARKIGYGATLEGRYDNADILIEGIIGPTLAERTYLEAVKEGAICEIVVIILRVKINTSSLRGHPSRDQVYKSVVYENADLHQKIRAISEDVIPKEWQTLIFIENEKQAIGIQKAMGEETTIAMAKRMTAKERDAVAARMKDGSITRCISSEIFATGVTFSNLQVVINATGGGGSISGIQKPGRLAEVRPNKRCGVMIDFMFEKDGAPEGVPQSGGNSPYSCVNIDSWARHRVYKNKGYTILWADTIDDVQKHLFDHCV
jgi:superfamily II DNA or RNA helicase